MLVSPMHSMRFSSCGGLKHLSSISTYADVWDRTVPLKSINHPSIPPLPVSIVSIGTTGYNFRRTSLKHNPPAIGGWSVGFFLHCRGKQHKVATDVVTLSRDVSLWDAVAQLSAAQCCAIRLYVSVVVAEVD